MPFNHIRKLALNFPHNEAFKNPVIATDDATMPTDNNLVLLLHSNLVKKSILSIRLMIFKWQIIIFWVTL